MLPFVMVAKQFSLPKYGREYGNNSHNSRLDISKVIALSYFDTEVFSVLYNSKSSRDLNMILYRLTDIHG